MKSILTFALTLALVTSCNQPAASHKGAGINLGKQLGPITLVTGNNNDLKSPSGSFTGIVRLIANASGSTLTGMDSTGASDGDMVFIRNEAAAGSVTITDSDTNSLPADRFTTAGSTGAVINPGKALQAEWDLTTGKWMVMTGGGGNDTFKGHLQSKGAVPALTSCGTSPSAVTGDDIAGTYTTGSAATTCTLTFATTYGTAPSCVVSTQGSATQPTYTVSATAITVTVDIASTAYSYICVGH